METKTRVLEIAAEIFEVETVTENMDQDSLEEWDSMNHLLLVSEIENQFKITIPIEESLNFKSIMEIIEYINKEG